MTKRTRTSKTKASAGQTTQPTDSNVDTHTDPHLNAHLESEQDEAIAPISSDAHADIVDAPSKCWVRNLDRPCHKPLVFGGSDQSDPGRY